MMYSCKINIFQLNYTIWRHKKRYLYTHIYKFWKITLNWHKHMWRSAINTLRYNMRKIRSIDFVSKFDISNDQTWERSLYLEIRKMLIKLCYLNSVPEIQAWVRSCNEHRTSYSLFILFLKCSMTIKHKWI